MHFVGIDIPDKLIKAALNGELVILAGAGVSMQPPVRLQSFDSLVEDIKKAVDPAGKIPPRKYLLREIAQGDGAIATEAVYTEAPEHYLGRLKDAGRDVHKACAELLGNQTRTTDLHRNIVRLFGGRDYIKLITTNFDNCFDVALEELKLKPSRYEAPALPPGRSFNGIVYLHGTAKTTENQVLTSADYGAAYLTDAWAARFLASAMTSHTVLLVGYSCGDFVVDYLARALAQGGKDNVFTLDRADKLPSSEEDWRGRGITPIPYGDYSELPALFDSWANFNAMSIYDRAERVRLIAEMPGTIDSESSEFLEIAFRDSDQDRRIACIRSWCENATDQYKFRWAYEHGALTCLYNSSDKESDTLLRTWAIETYLEQGCTELAKVFESGQFGSFSQLTLQQILHTLWVFNANDRCAAFWIPILDKATSLFIFDLIGLLENAQDIELKLRLIELIYRIRPVAHYDSFSPLSSNPLSLVNHHYGEYPDAAEVLESIHDDVPLIGPRLLLFCINEIEHAYVIKQALPSSDQIDMMSYMRRSIEPLETDNGNAIDRLINLTACLAKELVSDGLTMDGVTQICLSSPNDLTFRVGVYIRSLGFTTPQEAIRFVEEHNFVTNLTAKYEAFSILATHFPKLYESEQSGFIDRITNECRAKWDLEHGGYELLDLLVWLRRYCPDSEPLARAIERMSQEFPKYREGKHPEFNWYSTEATWIDDSLAENQFTLNGLREIQANAQVSPDGFRSIVRDSANKYPLRAFGILEGALACGHSADKLIAQVLLEMLNWKAIAEEEPSRALALLLEALSDEDLRGGSLNALSIAYQNDPNETLLSQWGAVTEAAISHLDWAKEQGSKVQTTEGQDWLIRGINQPAGYIIGIFARYAQHRYATDNAKETSLFASMLNSLDDILRLPGDTYSGIRSVLFSRLELWYTIAQAETTNSLIPLLVAGNGVSESCFDGLSYSAVSPALWSGISTCIASAIDHGQVGHLNKRGMLRLFALIVYYDNSQDNPKHLLNLIERRHDCLDTSLRTIRTFCRQKTQEEILVEWDSWLSVFLSELRGASTEANAKVSTLALALADSAPSLTTRVVALLGGADTLLFEETTISPCSEVTLQSILNCSNEQQFTKIVCYAIQNSKSVGNMMCTLAHAVLSERAAELSEGSRSAIRDAFAIAGKQHLFDWDGWKREEP